MLKTYFLSWRHGRSEIDYFLDKHVITFRLNVHLLEKGENNLSIFLYYEKDDIEISEQVEWHWFS
jgi:hypothetical protein